MWRMYGTPPQTQTEWRRIQRSSYLILREAKWIRAALHELLTLLLPIEIFLGSVNFASGNTLKWRHWSLQIERRNAPLFFKPLQNDVRWMMTIFCFNIQIKFVMDNHDHVIIHYLEKMTIMHVFQCWNTQIVSKSFYKVYGCTTYAMLVSWMINSWWSVWVPGVLTLYYLSQQSQHYFAPCIKTKNLPHRVKIDFLYMCTICVGHVFWTGELNWGALAREISCCNSNFLLKGATYLGKIPIKLNLLMSTLTWYLNLCDSL